MVRVADRELVGLMRAGGDDGGIVAVIQQTGDVFDPRIQLKFDAFVDDLLDFPVEQVPRQPVRREYPRASCRPRWAAHRTRSTAWPSRTRSSPAVSPAGPAPMMATRLPVGGGLCLKGVPDDGLVAHIGQIGAVSVGPIRDEALEAHDIDRIVDEAPAARDPHTGGCRRARTLRGTGARAGWPNRHPRTVFRAPGRCNPSRAGWWGRRPGRARPRAFRWCRRWGRTARKSDSWLCARSAPGQTDCRA